MQTITRPLQVTTCNTPADLEAIFERAERIAADREFRRLQIARHVLRLAE